MNKQAQINKPFRLHYLMFTLYISHDILIKFIMKSFAEIADICLIILSVDRTYLG